MARIAAQLPSRRTAVLLTIYLLVLWGLTAAGRFVPNLARQDKFEDDAPQHVWWTYRFADPTLFPNDEMARFMSGPPCAPPGYRTIYRLAVPHFDAQRVSETIPIVLSVLLMAGALLMGYRAGGGWAGAIFLSLVIVQRLYFDHLQGGFPRAFGLPIMLFAMWALMARRLGLLGLAFLAAALFYPPCLVPPVMCTAVALSWDFWKTRRLPKGWLVMGILLAASVVLLLMFMKGLPKEFGPIVTPSEARVTAEFQPHARAEYFNVGWRQFIFDSPLSGFGYDMWVVLGFFGLVILSVIIFGNFVPTEGWLLLIGSLLSFIAAHILIFHMHVPNRHVQYPMVVFRLIWLAALVPPVIKLLNKPLTWWPVLQKIKTPVVVAALLIALIIIGTSSIKRMRKTLKLPVDQDMENAYAFINTLPKNTLVAAHPYDANAVPLRTQRSVLACWETYHPYWVGYAHYIQPRVAAEIKAQYASDWKDVQALNEKYGVSVYLVNDWNYWSDEAINFCYPYTAGDLAAVAEGREKGFALLNPPEGRVLYRSGHVSVVRLSP